MNVVDDLLEANLRYSSEFHLGHLEAAPVRRLAVVACMDARLTVEQILGLKTGDAHIIRNAGGIVTDDALRSLVISHHLLKTSEFVVINHTDCGMLTFRDAQLRDRLQQETGTAPESPRRFHAFSNLEENVQMQLQRITSHPWISDSVRVRGFVYDVTNGKLNEVTL